jgi:hypothetical protein
MVDWSIVYNHYETAALQIYSFLVVTLLMINRLIVYICRITGLQFPEGVATDG